MIPELSGTSSLTLRQQIAVVFEGERGYRWAGVIALSLVAAALEASTASAVFVFLSGASQANPAAWDWVARLAPDADAVDRMTLVACAVAVLLLARSAALLAQSYVQSRLVEGVGVRLANRLLKTYLDVPYRVHIRTSSAKLIRNVFGGVSEVATGIMEPALRVASDVVMILALIFVLVRSAPVPTMVVGLAVVPVAVLIDRRTRPRLGELGRLNQVYHEENLRILQHSIDTFRDLKLRSRGAYYLEHFSRTRKVLARTRYLRALLSDVPRVGVETTATLFVLGYVSFSYVTHGSIAMALPTLGLFAYSVMRLMPALGRIMVQINNLEYGRSAIAIISADLSRPRDNPPTAESTADTSEPFTDRIELRNVSFCYDDESALALTDISLEIKAGECVGIVGRTGSGKSTLLDIILGLLDPTAGEVVVDHRPLPECRSWWQGQIGLVSQSIALVDDTLRRNIAFALSDDDIDDEAVWVALEQAQLAESVRSLPEGLSTRVGERGVRLSGGQRQRVGIARALYGDPAVLVLDEATASLDPATESEFMDALFRAKSGRTLIMVTHRLVTTQRCDRVCLLDGGRLLANGPPGEIAARGGSLSTLSHGMWA